MPLRPDHRPGRHVLVDAAGEPVASFERCEREGRMIADLLELAPGVTVERAVPAILEELQGMRVAGSEALGAALVAAGGRARRHAHVLTHDLRDTPEPPDVAGVEMRDADVLTDDLVAAYRSAYTGEHPDAAARAGEDTRAALARVFAGDYGPLLGASGVAVDPSGRAVGAVLITYSPGVPPGGGPWVTELFRAREPVYAGTGRALLERALARAAVAGLPGLGLAVTAGNRALHLYEAVGFRRVFTTLSVDI